MDATTNEKMTWAGVVHKIIAKDAVLKETGGIRILETWESIALEELQAMLEDK